LLIAIAFRHTILCTYSVPGKGKGTGFVGHLKCNNKESYFLITCNHVLKSKPEAQNAEITFEQSHEPEPIKGDKLFDLTSRTGWYTDNGTNPQDNVRM